MLGSTTFGLVFVIASIPLAYVITHFVMNSFRLREETERNKDLAVIRQRIRDRIRVTMTNNKEYVQVDRHSYDSLRVIKSTKPVIDPQLSRQRSAEIRLTSYPSGTSHSLPKLVTVYRFPRNSIKVHFVTIPWKESGQRRALKQAWRNPKVATLEQLEQLEYKMNHWTAKPANR